MIMMAMMKLETVYDNRQQRKAHDNIFRLMIIMIMMMIMLIIGPWLTATIMINLFFHSELDRSKESVGEVENLMDMPLSMVKYFIIIIIIIIIVIVMIILMITCKI